MGRIGRIGLIFFMFTSLLTLANEAALTSNAASSFSPLAGTDPCRGYPFHESGHPDHGRATRSPGSGQLTLRGRWPALACHEPRLPGRFRHHAPPSRHREEQRADSCLTCNHPLSESSHGPNMPNTRLCAWPCYHHTRGRRLLCQAVRIAQENYGRRCSHAC